MANRGTACVRTEGQAQGRPMGPPLKSADERAGRGSIVAVTARGPADTTATASVGQRPPTISTALSPSGDAGHQTYTVHATTDTAGNPSMSTTTYRVRR